MEEIKKTESDVLGYNVMKFDVVYLNLVLKTHLNLKNMTQQT